MSWFDFTPDQMKWGMTSMNLLSAGTSYQAAKEQTQARQKWQAYSNAMVNIIAAQNEGNISQDETNAVRDKVASDVNIQKGGLLTEGKAAVMAGAAGVQGRSVDQTLLEIQTNAAQKERNNQIDLNNQLEGFQAQRNQQTTRAAMEQDYSSIPTPNASSFLLPALAKSASLFME